jgi:plasmid replication initiation protein
VNDIRRYVGLSSAGFKEELIALLTAIEANFSQKELASSSKLVSKENRELKRLSRLLEYDSKGGSSSQDKIKGRALFFYK